MFGPRHIKDIDRGRTYLGILAGWLMFMFRIWEGNFYAGLRGFYT
jgi:hypothetical protein